MTFTVSELIVMQLLLRRGKNIPKRYQEALKSLMAKIDDSLKVAVDTVEF